MSFRTVYGYTISENGWRMCDRNECDIPRINELYFTDTAPLRVGAPLTILGAWLYWYDRNVEEILSSVWGWSNTNDVGNSNHLSGTAVDLNAPKYPWGQRVMPADRIAKIRKGLALFEGTVFWGADWDRADEMHYQMALREGDPRNEAFAAKLRNGHLGIYGPPPTTQEDAPLSRAEVDEIKKYIKDFTEGFNGPIYETAAAALKEETGSKIVGEFPGFTELGNRTQVQALQAILDHLGIGPRK